MMKRIVRIGKLGDQDNWRRDGILKMPPSERVDLLFQMQNNYHNQTKLARTVTIRSFKK